MTSYLARARTLKVRTWALILMAATAAGCGSSDDDNGSGGNAAPLSCGDLIGLAVPASAMALPTNGALVTSALIVPAGGTAPKTFGEYCRISAEINPIDPTAPKIMMQIALPTAWNRKAMMRGGGGYNGSIPNVGGSLLGGPANQPDPVGRGYAVFGSDSGHVGASNTAAFGVNDEALRNFAFEALKKTRDTAIFVINRRYGANPERSYFYGDSTGGREALAFTQKWPNDFNGVIALYPAYNAASLDLQFGRITRALAAPGAYSNLAKRKVLYDAAIQACDGLDGVADGLISNQPACDTLFNPATATLNGQPVRCAGGGDLGDSCLSDAQIAVFNVINTPIVFSYPLANGETSYPGFTTWGTDFGRPGTGTQALVNWLGLNSVAPTFPMPAPPAAGTPGIPYHTAFWDQWVKFIVTRNANFNSLTLDPENPGVWQARISELTGLQDMNRTDLSAFEARGGKILMAHGIHDQLVSNRATQIYYNNVRSTMGAARTDGFMRYYEIPGYNHAFSTVFSAAWDSITTLENWVERGIAPANQIVTDTVGVPGRTRPLCEYPTFPRYTGTGDVNSASSFACVLI